MAVLVASGSARADHKIAVAATGGCPDRDAVAAALVEAMPDAAIVDAPDGATSAIGVERVPIVAVSDDGAHYRAMVDGVARSFEDAAANCSDRARKVAVVAALAIEPPSVAAPAPPPVAGVVVAERPVVVPRWLRGAQLWLEIGYGISQGAGRTDTMYPLGVSGRLVLERGHWGASIGGTWSSQEVYAPTLAQRFPFDLSVSRHDAVGPVLSVIELGASVARYQVTDELFPPQMTDATEVGGRVAWRLEWRSPWRVGVYASAAASFAFHAARVVTDAYDVTYPSPWLDVAAGLSARLY